MKLIRTSLAIGKLQYLEVADCEFARKYPSMLASRSFFSFRLNIGMQKWQLQVKKHHYFQMNLKSGHVMSKTIDLNSGFYWNIWRIDTQHFWLSCQWMKTHFANWILSLGSDSDLAHTLTCKSHLDECRLLNRTCPIFAAKYINVAIWEEILFEGLKYFFKFHTHAFSKKFFKKFQKFSKIVKNPQKCSKVLEKLQKVLYNFKKILKIFIILKKNSKKKTIQNF